MRLGTKGLARASAATMGAIIGGLLFAAPAVAVPDEDKPQKQESAGDRMVPIPGWSKDVTDNGCRMRAEPGVYHADPLTNPREIPQWVLVRHQVGRFAVRATLDPPETFAKSLEPLDPDVRTLTLLTTLQYGLGPNGLHSYFHGDAGQYAPAVRDALEAAGLAREHALFVEAMAVFGSVYPVDNEARGKAFGNASSSQEINDLDRRLLAMSAEFGSGQDWIGVIVAYVGRTPALWQRIEQGRKTLGEMARLEHLTSALRAPLDFWKPYAEVREKLKALSEPQRTILVLAAFNDEFENGGVHQFFYNAEGAIAPEVVEVLEEIGLARQAALLRRGIAMFKAPYPRDTEQRREASFHDHDGWNDWDRRLSRLTDELYALDGGPQVLSIGGDRQIQGGPGLRYAMLAFAKHHDLLPC